MLRRARDLLATATRGAVHFPQRVISLFTEAIHLRNEHLRHPRSVPRKHLRERRDDFELRLLKLVSPTRIVPEPLDTS